MLIFDIQVINLQYLVQAWSPTVYLVRGSGKTRSINRQYPHTCNVYDWKHIHRQAMSVIAFLILLEVYQTF